MIVILVAVAVAVSLTDELTADGGIMAGVVIILAAEILLFSRPP